VQIIQSADIDVVEYPQPIPFARNLDELRETCLLDAVPFAKIRSDTYDLVTPRFRNQDFDSYEISRAASLSISFNPFFDGHDQHSSEHVT
jgi:hypothetical protein